MANYRIIEKLNKTGRNINTFVRVASSPAYNSEFGPTNHLTWEGNSYYHSTNQGGSYFTLSFFPPFYIKKFILKSAKNRDPRYWILEGSKNDVDFNVQLRKNDGEHLCDDWGPFDGSTMGCMDYLNKTYSVDAPGEYSSVRFRMYNVDSNNDHYLVLAAIDFIGSVLTTVKTCKKRKMNHINIFLVVFIIACITK